MARRSIWNGAISFGMVVIPVKLYPATDSKDISFVTLHNTCHNRIRQKRYCPYHEEEVKAGDEVRAYEYAKEQYVIMEEGDFENLPVPSKHNIEITQFVDLSVIDPMYFERSYSLEPDNIGLKPYYLLKKALETTGRVAIAKISIRQKEHLCCLRPFEQGITLETMHYPDEIRGNNELHMPEDEATLSEQEMGMAIALIDQLTGTFEPELHRDEYRAALERVIQGKLGAEEPVTAAPTPPKGKVGDLMEALRASIEATKTERSGKTSTPGATTKPEKKTATRKVKSKAAS